MYVEAAALGIEVYGQEQYDYIVNGVEHRLFSESVKHAALDRATSVEAGVTAYQSLIRRRLEKLEDLGKAFATVSEAAALLAKAKSSSDTVNLDGLTTAGAILDKYGVTKYFSDSSISKENVSRQSQEIRHALDMEDNNIQQDMTSIQGFLNKRDKAFQLAGKLTSKSVGTLSQVIKQVS